MVNLLIFVYILLLNNATFNCGHANEEEDYYEKLIKQGIRHSNSYQFPKDASEYKPINSKPIGLGSYDFIVIGGGSAGSVVANRLSEIKQWRVLLLEAGQEGNNFTDIPSMSAYTLNSEYNWGFTSVPQKECCLLLNGICPFPRGKGLGGTSLINALGYSRGNRRDYDKWEELGNPGWSYKDVLPYFMKSENSNINGDKGYHGFGGYLNVEYHYPLSKRVDIFLQANKEQGKRILDYNGKEQFGASLISFTTIDGKRLTSAKAFLDPVRHRTNLKILTGSYVTKILISNTTNKAYGVIFSHKNKQYFVKVNMEVILSAGVIGSPRILMLSGIGPEKHLQEVGIPLIKNLDVGGNMHDHPTLYSNFFFTFQNEPSFTLREAVRQYLDNRTGPLTISLNPQAISFYKLNLTDNGAPDIEVVLVPSIKTIKGGFHRWVSPIIENNVFEIVIVLLHPKTRGRVYLKSNNPYDYPLIDSKCFDDPNNEDVEGLYKGTQVVLDMINTDAYRAILPILAPYPGCLGKGFLTEQYWKCLIRETAMNAFHASGTCTMGPNPSEGAVVNNRLQVHELANIRVADTSIIPSTTSGHMNAPAMMIGERVADFIKEDYGVLDKNM